MVELNAINKFKLSKKRGLSDCIDTSNTHNMKTEPSPKKRRTASGPRSKKFTWCVSRKKLVIQEAISEQLFAMVESKHDEVVERIYSTACLLDDIFFCIDAREVKSMIYQIQRRVASTPTEKISGLAGYEKTFRENLKELQQLDGAFYVKHSTS